MTLEILPIPEIPRPLRVAAEQRTLVPFIGAGVSMLAGAPNWNGFANKAFAPFVKALKIDHGLLEQLQEYDPRTRLSIASNLVDATTKISYAEILHPSGVPSNPIGIDVYGLLGALAKVWVTTNYDNWAEPIFPNPLLTPTAGDSTVALPTKRTRYHKPEDFRPEYLDNENTVFHLHGCLLNEPGMIVTTRDYLRHYASRSTDKGEQNQTLLFLKYLFERRNLLFIGYTLGEPEILEYVIQKSANPHADETAEPRHAILMPFFSHQSKIVEHLDGYFRGLGVKLLPYRKDENNYMQLASVIAHYAKELQPVGTATTKEIDDLEALL